MKDKKIIVYRKKNQNLFIFNFLQIKKTILIKTNNIRQKIIIGYRCI